MPLRMVLRLIEETSCNVLSYESWIRDQIGSQSATYMEETNDFVHVNSLIYGGSCVLATSSIEETFYSTLMYIQSCLAVALSNLNNKLQGVSRVWFVLDLIHLWVVLLSHELINPSGQQSEKRRQTSSDDALPQCSLLGFSSDAHGVRWLSQ
jgi:hypothetical protein